jgi:actin related protein 2/3 complex subunit 2
MGSDEIIARLFPGMETNADAGYNIALEFNCDSLENPEVFLANISDLRRHISAGPLDRAFTALVDSKAAPPTVAVPFRKTETMWVAPQAGKVSVIFLIDFTDATDKAVARVFLQEFVEAQRTVRTAPPVSFSREPPGEISKSFTPSFKADDFAGFISFSLELRHIQGVKKENAITMLTGFRNYLQYHIKCSKTYLHMRMRKRVATWLQVLNRAVPEVETEKKLASGKTFVKK